MGAKEQLAQMMEAIQENYEQLPDGLKTTIAQLSTKNLKRSSAEGSSAAAAAGAAAKKMSRGTSSQSHHASANMPRPRVTKSKKEEDDNEIDEDITTALTIDEDGIVPAPTETMPKPSKRIELLKAHVAVVKPRIAISPNTKGAPGKKGKGKAAANAQPLGFMLPTIIETANGVTSTLTFSQEAYAAAAQKVKPITTILVGPVSVKWADQKYASGDRYDLMVREIGILHICTNSLLDPGPLTLMPSLTLQDCASAPVNTLLKLENVMVQSVDQVRVIEKYGVPESTIKVTEDCACCPSYCAAAMPVSNPALGRAWT